MGLIKRGGSNQRRKKCVFKYMISSGILTRKKYIFPFLDRFLKNNLSFKIATSGWASGRCRAVGCQASSEVYLLVNRFSKLYVTFILQWIAFIFGRDEEEDQ